MPDACAQASKNGFLPGSLNRKLSRKSPASMEEVRARARLCILDEEDDAFKCKRATRGRDGVSSRRSTK